MMALKKHICRLIGHQWSDWEYCTDGSCLQQRQCERCHVTATRGPIHRWGSPILRYLDSCEGYCSCDRCGEDGPSYEYHQWGHWGPPDLQGTRTRQCNRCGQIDSDLCPTCEGQGSIGVWIGYDFVATDPSQPYCSRCGGSGHLSSGESNQT